MFIRFPWVDYAQAGFPLNQLISLSFSKSEMLVISLANNEVDVEHTENQV